MKLVIISLVNVLAIGGGVAAGSLFSSAPPAEKAIEPALPEEPVPAPEDVAPPVPNNYFPLSFSRPFIVPVTEGWRTRSLVVLELSVNVHEDATERTPGFSQRARDRIMSALVALSHDGAFATAVTDPDLRESVRQTVAGAVAELAPGQVGEVYIVEMLERPL